MRKIFGALILLAILMLALPVASPAQIAVGISVHVGPPALPVYVQPVCPAPGYIWTPGYWAYGDDDYYWVPGTWVLAPSPGLLWTPGYWGWSEGVYIWHGGYWGPHVGFYGGINYGFGYGGVGFVGGRWNHGVFAYNTAVTNVNTTVIHNTYINKTVINNNVTVNRVSFNGGNGGTRARPTSEERIAERDHHIEATHLQAEHEHSARQSRELRASENHGRPSIAATGKPGEFKGHGVVAASAAGEHGGFKGDNRPNNAGHDRGNNAAEMHKADRPPSAHGGGNDNRPQNTSHVDNGRNNAHGNNGGGNAAHVNERMDSPRSMDRPHGNNGGNAPRMNNAAPPQHGPQHENAPRAPQHENAPRPQGQPHQEGKPQGGEKPHKG